MPSKTDVQESETNVIQRPRLNQMLITLVLVAIATPALASLIYSWQSQDGAAATGRIQFSEAGLYDAMGGGPVIEEFSFTTPEGVEAAPPEFAFADLGAVEVGGEVLCFGACTEKKAAKKKAAKKTAAKRKTAAKKGTPIAFSPFDGDLSGFDDVDPLAAMNWLTADETGYGYWARVAIPEPSTLLLMFMGLSLLGFARRRVTRR